MSKFIGASVIMFIPWVLLAGSDPSELILGATVAMVIAGIIYRNLDYAFKSGSLAGAIKFLVVYVPVFLWELVKANIDVAFRVLNPRMPINPGFVKIPTGIKGDYGRLALANSITLTPGTLSVDGDENHLYVHWIDVMGESQKERGELVSGPFEDILGGIFK
ncbi:MAG: cation:proton antiporter [delta proteobacterium ML8_F1]|nr:MAG: cation:proton antiporter [delta proteobacterium ML8_F1]